MNGADSVFDFMGHPVFEQHSIEEIVDLVGSARALRAYMEMDPKERAIIKCFANNGFEKVYKDQLIKKAGLKSTYRGARDTIEKLRQLGVLEVKRGFARTRTSRSTPVSFVIPSNNDLYRGLVAAAKLFQS